MGEAFALIIRLSQFKPTSYDFGLVAVDRPILADPNWVTKLRTGWTSELKGFGKETLSELIPE